MEIKNETYVRVAAALCYMLRDLEINEEFGPGLFTSNAYLCPNECHHFYEFLKPFVEKYGDFNATLQQLKEAAEL